MSGTPPSTPSMTPSWTLPLPAGGRRQFLPIDIEANIPADNGSHQRKWPRPRRGGAQAVAASKDSHDDILLCAGSAPGAPTMQRGQRWQEKLGWRSHTVEVRLETQMQLPRQPRGRWLSAFPVKLRYRDFTGAMLPPAANRPRFPEPSAFIVPNPRGGPQYLDNARPVVSKCRAH